MRVAFVSTVHGHTWPGSEFLWGDTASRLLAEGHQVFARCSADFRDASALRKLVENGLIYDPAPSSTSRVTRLKERLRDPLATLAAWQPDVVVISSGSAFDIAYNPSLARYLAKTTVPFIPICHFNAETFWVDEPNREVMKRIYGRAALAIFVSEDNHRITERQLATKIRNYHVIRPPLPVQLDQPLRWPSSQGDAWNFACVARWESRWKGQDVLFEVLSSDAWRTRNWRLNLYGEGGEEGYLRSLAEHYGIAEKVSFVGFVKDRVQIWRENHLQVFPTRGEGGPMVLTEGMMCGRPAVITNCGNVTEYVDNGIDGFVADFATPRIFGETMENAWARRQEWEEMGRRSHVKMKAQGFENNCVVELLSLIRAAER
jgi:glycosyltransferase involved in cell wall biosynthesis